MKVILKTLKLPLLSFFLLLVLSSCSLPVRTNPPTPTIDLRLVGTIAAMTLQSMPAATRAISETPPVLSPLTTATPGATSTTTPTYTLPMVLFEGNTNCRKGPGTSYDVITVILNGQKAEAIAVSETGNYWLVKNPNKGDPCWVANDLAKPSGSILQLPTVIAPATSTPVPPNAPAWSTYNYTCEYASGGSNMTMNLAWTDRSSNEDGFTVYRDQKVVATLAPNVNAYVDVAFVASGTTVSYKVEVFNKAGRASSSTITAGCQ
jgi:hypothetical protein